MLRSRSTIPRIILTEDGGQLIGLPEPATGETVESFIASYAGQGIDVLSYGMLGTDLPSLIAR